MLTIRAKQMEEFERVARIRFERSLLKQMSQIDDQRFAQLGETRASALVSTAITRAKRWGVVADKDVSVMVLCDFLRGQPFENATPLGWARRLLADENVSGGAKAEMLRRNVLEPAIAAARSAASKVHHA